MVSKIDGMEEPLVITSDMLIQMPTKGNEVKSLKETFEKNMSTTPLFILIIILLNLISYIFEISTGALTNLPAMLQAGALSHDLVLQGEYWRLVSAGFLHANKSHLVGNLSVLYILGMATEHAFGIKKTILIYFFALVAGSLCSVAMGTQTGVGASGAVFGLMGALCVYFRKNRHRFNIRDGNIGIFIAIVAIIQILFGFTNPHIDNYAHIGGCLGGAIIALLLSYSTSMDHRQLPQTSRYLKIITLLSLFTLSIVWLAINGHVYLVIAELSDSYYHSSAAIQYSTRSVKINPNNTNAYIVRGKAYFFIKQYANAINDLQLYLATNPNSVIGYQTLGGIYDYQKNRELAIKCFSDGISVSPQPNLYNSRGYNRILMGDYKLSREDFQSAIKLDKNYAPAYGNLGLLDAIDGSYESAIKQLEKSYELDRSLKIITGQLQ